MLANRFLTVDVEDWASSSLALLSTREAARVAASVPARDPQLERGVRRLLELLDTANATATFFVVGALAEVQRKLLREIVGQGHEIGSHSWSHLPMSTLTGSRLDFELRASREALEDIVGMSVRGFRAPYLSGPRQVHGFGARLLEAGYRYDSSYREDAFGHSPPREVAELGSGGPREYPISVVRRGFIRLPFGGTSLKLLGEVAAVKAIRGADAAGRTTVVYLHPYEIDRSPLRWPHPRPTWRAKFALLVRNVSKASNERIVTRLLQEGRFTSIARGDLDVPTQPPENGTPRAGSQLRGSATLAGPHTSPRGTISTLPP